ncbi:hypothetical protein ABZ934_03420 [Streptomyces sp. NPDC046557]|uniref:hypothetical protein n=1 Tax=Streptomyces sp. NPDC046557 TaxID=3155372 RepID=UPI003406441F
MKRDAGTGDSLSVKDGQDMALLADSTPEQQDIAFIDVLDPAFRFTSPEVAQAREKHW